MKKQFITALLLMLLLAGENALGQQIGKDSSFTFLYNAVKSESDAVRMEPLVLKMRKMLDRVTGSVDRKVMLFYSETHLAETFAEQGNFSKTVSWIDMIDDIAWKESAVLSSTYNLLKQGRQNDAGALVKPYLLSSEIIPEKSDVFVMQTRVPRAEFYAAYGIISYRKGEFQKALYYLAPADTNLRTKSPEIKEYLTLALIGAGRDAEIPGAVKDAIEQKGERSDEFRKDVANYYRKHYGSTKTFDEWILSAASRRKDLAIKEMLRYATNQQAPDFTISDVNGKKVSLSSLKGKIVLIDFWATWCVPCVGSFPGMQRAVDFYKKDTSVVFMFVHTSEHSATATEDAMRLLRNQKYTFNLYMDLIDSATHKNPLQQAFHVKALPTKFVINKNGVIKFENIGFLSENQAVDEISAMIEMARKP